MNPPVTLVNIAAAGVMMQVAISIIVVAGVFSFRVSGVSPKAWRDSWSNRHGFGESHLYGLTILMLIISLCSLGLSVDFAAIWKPLTHNLRFAGFATDLALRGVFFTDIVFIGLLLRFTGGSRDGPFSPLCFILPPLAVFLQQPFFWIFVYVALLAIIFTYTLRAHHGSYGVEATFAYWLVSILGVALTTFIAYLTQSVTL
jgi:uncharacterized membrane protein YqaE (UPF0057 family)